MSCITIIRRTPFPRDEPLFQRVLEAGLRAAGGPVGDRRCRLFDGGGDSGAFHVILDGPFDCHVYPFPSLTAVDLDPRVAPAHLVDAIRGPYAHLHIEAPFTDVGHRMVAAGAAELLDDECLALVDFETLAIVPATPETADLLRSGSSSRVFSGALRLVKQDAVSNEGSEAP